MKKNVETLQEKWIRKFGADNVFNRHCDHLIVLDGEYKCRIKMDMSHCGNKCVYATNVSLSNVVDKRGKVKGIKNNDGRNYQ